jgi:hypothetical protein
MGIVVFNIWCSMKIRLSKTTRYDFPKLIDALHIHQGVEIGVSKGAYSHYLLKESSLDLLWSIDPYVSKGRKAEQIDAAANLAEFGDRSKLMRMASTAAAKQAADRGERFGFVYIDGNHLETSVRNDLTLWLDVLARPGIFAGHDYVPNRNRCDVIPVVNEFAEKLQMPLYLTAEHWASWFFVFGD